MKQIKDTQNRNSRTSDWPTLYDIQIFCRKKICQYSFALLPSVLHIFLVFLCKKILGYWGKQLIDYSSDKVAKFHITEPETIMDGVQKILKTMFHTLLSVFIGHKFCQQQTFPYSRQKHRLYHRPFRQRQPLKLHQHLQTKHQQHWPSGHVWLTSIASNLSISSQTA